jgi:phage gp36-like protein
MGRYINWEDLVGRYSQINKIGGAESVGSNYIQYAEAEVDARLACCYTVPFSGTPVTIKDLCIDVALLKATFGREKSWDRMKTYVDDRFKMICSGQIQVAYEDGSIISQVGGTIWGSNEDYTPIFGMGDTLDFVVDSDRIDDEDDARD